MSLLFVLQTSDPTKIAISGNPHSLNMALSMVRLSITFGKPKVCMSRCSSPNAFSSHPPLAFSV